MRILRPKEAAKRLGIGHSKFWADVAAGRLPPLVRLGPRVVGHIEEELDAYIERLPRVLRSPTRAEPHPGERSRSRKSPEAS